MPSLFAFYEQMIILDITEEIQEYIENISYKTGMIDVICSKPERSEIYHQDRLFEFTTHPSQTWDTLIKQKVREAKHQALQKTKKGEVINGLEYAQEQAKNIFEDCKKRIYSLENAKIPAHAQMTAQLLQKVPAFFDVYKRYTTLSPWQAEEKAEEKNISFSAFLDEEKQDPVYLDERLEAVMTAKKMLLSGESRFYQWIDFDGAKRPDGIMLSIFAELVIDDINQSARGISERDFVRENSLFTLAEREENRMIVNTFHRIDRSIYALTRHLASKSEDTENAVCIAQMEQLKKDRERFLRKLVKIKDECKRRKEGTTENNIVYLSERVHFIPRFDPKFITALQKSNLGNTLELLSSAELQHYKTASHIIDQVITLNSLSPDSVCQIILAQCTCASEIITLEQFMKEKVKWWKEKKSHFLAEDPLYFVSLCPLLETKKTTKPALVLTMMNELLAFYGKEMFKKRIPEMFFAGSDLSKSMGSSSSFVRTWECAIGIWKWNIENECDVRIKLGSGESTFRQSGFLDPKFQKSVFHSDLSNDQKNFLRNEFGVHWEQSLKRKGNGMLSLVRKYPWLNGITLQSKAREWIMSMGAYRLSELLQALQSIKASNRKVLQTENPDQYNPSDAVQAFVKAENKAYEAIIGKETDTQKKCVSLPALIELFATEITPVLRDRALKRNNTGEKTCPSEILVKIASSGQINARAIAANTASSVLYPLALLGKGEGFEASSASALMAFEAFDILQVIRQFSPIASSVFDVLQKNGFAEIRTEIEQSWEKAQKMVPFLIEKILIDSFPQVATQTKERQEACIACFEPSLRALFSASYDEKTGLTWHHTSSALEKMQENWNLHASSIVAKACRFLSGMQKEYPFSKADIQQWDLFLTIHCRLRGDKGLLG